MFKPQVNIQYKVSTILCKSDTFFSNVIIKSAFKEYITITKGLVLPNMMSFDTV